MKHPICWLGLHDWRQIPDNRPRPAFICPRCGAGKTFDPPAGTVADAIELAAASPAPLPPPATPEVVAAEAPPPPHRLRLAMTVASTRLRDPARTATAAVAEFLVGLGPLDLPDPARAEMAAVPFLPPPPPAEGGDASAHDQREESSSPPAPVPPAPAREKVPSDDPQPGAGDDASTVELTERQTALLNEIISTIGDGVSTDVKSPALAMSLSCNKGVVVRLLRILRDKGFIRVEGATHHRKIIVCRWPDGRDFIVDGESGDDGPASTADESLSDEPALEPLAITAPPIPSRRQPPPSPSPPAAAPRQPRRRSSTHPQSRKPRDRSVQDRKCLSCGKTFHSEGPHNRMCDPCRSSAEDFEGDPHIVHGRQP